MGDKVLIAGMVLTAVLFMAFNAGGESTGRQITAVITQNGNLIQQINLSTLKNPDYIYLHEPINQVILAEPGRIRFLESDCPNQICVKTGWLTKAGDRAVCMPSRVVITIMGDNRQVDSIAY